MDNMEAKFRKTFQMLSFSQLSGYFGTETLLSADVTRGTHGSAR